ncbi:hypothetical protein K2173_025263 [Erythroxylum novogranatense]|uniref:Short-chain dehydrogenase/reductase n=1 Tax=Erythroxylum novogranatense TaxID=1862640 RepID=A0AAV8UDI2_9ROSI|nr:hypothetical protein K2173_025263 [Erythroxylum novogranatense]
MAEATKRYAVVTGANKGIGFEICRQLASNGIFVVLTARDEKRGVQAVEKLKDSGGLSDYVIFHQLDVADDDSISSFADFIRNRFGKVDILVNNAAVSGSQVDADGLRASVGKAVSEINWSEISTQTYELAEECLKINYYGAKKMAEALLPLLRLSDSPRIVNVSALRGKLEVVPNEWAKGVLSNAEELTEEKVDEVLDQFLKDFKEGSLEIKRWPAQLSAYTMSKAAVNAYSRMLAKRHPTFCINCVCPGFVKTDINFNTGYVPVEVGAEGPVRLALLPNGGPSGCFFSQMEESSF